MSDHQGKGPANNEGRVERNTSRPTENGSSSSRSAQSSASKLTNATKQRVHDTLQKK